MDEKKQAILDAALALADEKGLAAVSMRAVAERAGLTAMALYPHVGSKAALLDEMTGRLLATMKLPDAAGQDWQHRLRGLAHAARALVHDHPWAATLLFSRPAVTPDAAHTVDIVYSGLLDAGVPESEVARLERMLSTVVLGYAASEVGGRFEREKPPDIQERRALLRGQFLPGHQRIARWLEIPVEWDAEFEADLNDLVRIVEAISGRSPA
jgi:AcrR family transcriptional regulator